MPNRERDSGGRRTNLLALWEAVNELLPWVLLALIHPPGPAPGRGLALLNPRLASSVTRSEDLSRAADGDASGGRRGCFLNAGFLCPNSESPGLSATHLHPEEAPQGVLSSLSWKALF